MPHYLKDVNLDQRDRYASSFNSIYWAFVPILLDVTIRVSHGFGLDLLPDLIGFVLIYFASRKLLPLHENTRAITRISLFLMLLGLFTWFDYQYAFSFHLFSIRINLLVPFTLFADLLVITMVWKLLGLVKDLANHTEHRELARKADSRRLLFGGLKLIVMLLSGLAYTLSPPIVYPVTLLVLFMNVFLLFLVLNSLSAAHEICKNDQKKNEPVNEGIISDHPSEQEQL